MSRTEKDYEELGKAMERTFLQSGVGRCIIEQKVADAVRLNGHQIELLSKTAEKYEEAVRILDDVATRLRIAPQSHYDTDYPPALGVLIRSALDMLATPNAIPARRTLVIASEYEGDITISQVKEKTRDGWKDGFYGEDEEEGDEKEFLIGDDPNSYGSNKFLLACKEFLGLEYEYVAELEWDAIEGIVQQLFDMLTDDPCVSLERYCEVLTEFIRPHNGTTWEWIVI